MSHMARWLWSTQHKSHLAKSGDCPSEGGDKVFLTSCDYMINESRDSIGSTLSP